MKNIFIISILILAITIISNKEVKADEHTFNVGYMYINQDLFETIKFNMDAAKVGYTYWNKYNIGFMLQYAKSTETINSLIVVPKYSATIKHLYSGVLKYRYQTSVFDIELGIGKTDYKTYWTVDGIRPNWYRDADSDISYHIGISKKLGISWKVGLEYADIYRKHKQGYGNESTNYYSFELSYTY